MRKVAGTSILRSATVAEYIQYSLQNEIILPQLVLCECLKGDGIQNARRSLIAIAHFPNQVSVLKSDRDLHALNPRSKGIQSRLIHKRSTQGFQKNLLFNLTRTGGEAMEINRFITHDKSQSDSVISIYNTIGERAKKNMLEERILLSHEEISAIRTQRFLHSSLLEKIERKVMKATTIALKHSSLNVKMISPKDGMYSVPFRFALAIEALSLDWIATGGLENRFPKSLSNDIIDMSHVAYSSFFDGILSTDRRLLRVASLVRMLLECFKNIYQ
jgi:hypothetical protein